jgi:sortase A
MVRASMPRPISGFERLLLFLGFLLLLLFAAAHVYTSIFSHAAIRAFWSNQFSSARVRADSSQHNLGIPDFRFWSQKRIEAYQASLIVHVPSPLGVLRISAINLEVPVLEGTDDLILNRAVGHIEGTAVPGAIGNVGIAGHRDGFFRGLKDIHTGDTLDLFAEKRNYRYVVDEIVIVPPEDVSVLAPRAEPGLTLITCYPFYFVGSAPLRYVVRATANDPNNLAKARQSRSPAEEQGGQDSH